MSLNLDIPYLGTALWVGWRYYRPFAAEMPADYEQTAVLAALLCAGAKDDNEAFRSISRLYAKTLRQYGYAPWADGNWARRELIRPKAAPRHACGLCAAAAPYRDARYTRLCARHAAYVRHRRQKGDADPYAGIEELDAKRRTPARRVVRCDNCGDVKRKWRHRLNQRVRNFCGQDCYNAARRKKTFAGRAFVTPHAVQRFQERVASLSYDAALGAIIKGLERPASAYSSGHGKGLVIEVNQPYEFKAVLMPGKGGKPAVVTILECERENDAARERRSARRRAA
ncbi:MAG TPA: hypothetical protein VF297_05120 [Pyrinomonadaceae bacterium]